MDGQRLRTPEVDALVVRRTNTLNQQTLNMSISSLLTPQSNSGSDSPLRIAARVASASQ